MKQIIDVEDLITGGEKYVLSSMISVKETAIHILQKKSDAKEISRKNEATGRGILYYKTNQIDLLINKH